MKTVKERAEMTMKLVQEVIESGHFNEETPCRVLIETVRRRADYHNLRSQFSLAETVQVQADAYNCVCHLVFPTDDFTKDIYERVKRELENG